MAKQGKGYWIEAPEKRIHPEGAPYYWLGGKWSAFDEDAESDVTLLEEGYAAGVPIHVGELTDHASFDKHKALLKNFEIAPVAAKII
jgi:5'-nucleotidase